jgi:2-methylcitrate dehydratase PrpD
VSASRPDDVLADWIATTDARWLDDLAAPIGLAFVDTLGCALAARAHPVRAAVAGLHDGPVGAWARPTPAGTHGSDGARGSMASASTAALVNATAAHALDFDDVLVTGRSHASAVLVPTVLAVGEASGASGREVAEAYAIGLEVLHAVAQASGLRDYVAGWHTTATHGSFGAAAAASRLLGLEAAATEHALSLAHSLAAGSKRQFGTAAKAVHAGLAARHGIEAARLAAAGIDAAAGPIFGPGGYLATHAATGAPDPLGSGQAVAALRTVVDDAPEAVHHLWRKPYPCCASAHAAIDATLATVGDRAAALRAVDVRLNPLDVANLPYRHPRTTAEARFSLGFCLAAAALRGDVDEAVLATPLDDAVNRLGELVTVTTDDGFQPGVAPSGRITFTFDDGSTATVDLDQPRGHPSRPLDAGTIEAKLAGHVPASLVGDVARIAAHHDVAVLTASLARGGGRAERR